MRELCEERWIGKQKALAMFLAVSRSSRPGQGGEGMPHRQHRPGKVTEQWKHACSGPKPLQSRSECGGGGLEVQQGSSAFAGLWRPPRLCRGIYRLFCWKEILWKYSNQGVARREWYWWKLFSRHHRAWVGLRVVRRLLQRSLGAMKEA